ncbi:hypothetical protein F8154_01610 [Alkaliphilus pronyensis]|uniref:Uncharacterized protein n=2 Tax=Alkaliphilus pronyensis TaxID=1482732 RepID=A0A6I0FIM8_9FIRM|nr:hypothetical protein F8154_01610 [Alkaliphilus pronyensis]
MYQQVKENNRQQNSSDKEEKIEATWHDILAMIIAAFQVILPIIIMIFAVIGIVLWLMMLPWK